MQNLRKVQNCAEALRALIPAGWKPAVGMVLGTGLGSLKNNMRNTITIPFEALPDFPPATVESHQSSFSLGLLENVPVIMQEGRCHQYEGRSPEEVCLGVRTMALLGAGKVILTNAAGALNPQYEAGDLMVIDDHINFTGQSPLTGPNEEAMGRRFPDMSRVYDRELIRCAEKTALALGIRLEKGVYISIPGPQLETPAETRAYRLLGADAIGMSTVQEVIALRHMGVKVLGISCLSNKNLPDCMAAHTHEEIIDMARRASVNLSLLLEALVPRLAVL